MAGVSGIPAEVIRVEVIRAWPRRYESVVVSLPAGATAGDAIAASGLDLAGIDGHAVFGERIEAEAEVRDGDRLELLQPLQLDPKQARRRRAAKGRPPAA
jgi:putative ubiquitin-RnfH superfamily antitoxin RatB of RatAB toxin-antitoxin module